MKKFIAEIIDNVDPNENGKCQIYCEFLHHDLQPSQYPWAKMDRGWTSDIPEIGDKVWVWFADEKFYRKPFYPNKINLENYNEHNESIGSLSGSYPDIKYFKLANGVSIALNSNQNECTITTGDAEIFIDSSGNIKINGTQIQLNGATKSFVTWVELNTQLQLLIVAINALFATKLNGSGSSGTLLLDISSAQTTTVLTGG